MKILVAVDEHPYSARAVNEVARLAANTWANVTLLGILPKKTPAGESGRLDYHKWSMEHPLLTKLNKYREDFLAHFAKGECPYLQRNFGYELIEVKNGVWEELYVAKSARKELRVRIRRGSPVKEILNEAKEGESDLIVLGCNQAKARELEGLHNLYHRISHEATSSVLVVKQEKKVNKIVCCLDHNLVSQQSLELINQLVTLYSAKLEIVGLTEGTYLRKDVEEKIDDVLRYYTAHNLQPWVQVVELSELTSFISQEAKWGLMALCMGKESILERVFPKGKITKLIKGSESSVLILK